MIKALQWQQDLSHPLPKLTFRLLKSSSQVTRLFLHGKEWYSCMEKNDIDDFDLYYGYSLAHSNLKYQKYHSSNKIAKRCVEKISFASAG